jgi:hypothetical protein
VIIEGKTPFLSERGYPCTPATPLAIQQVNIMKIKIESEKIIKAVKKLNGIEIILENPEDAKEAIDLIFSKSDIFEKDEIDRPKDVKVSGFQEYKTSAVDYKMIFSLEFLFEKEVPLERKVSFIKALQEFFAKT